MRGSLLIVLVAGLAGCEEPITPGRELLGEWGLIGDTLSQWRFDDDLTYLRSGDFQQRGQFWVEGSQLHLDPDPDAARSIAYDVTVTREHLLGLAQRATGPTTGRLGTFRGTHAYPDDDETVELTTTLRADRTAHLTRRTTTAGTTVTLDGDGVWLDPMQPNNSFIVSVTYPGGASDELTYWHIDDAIGQLAYQRISF